MWDLTDEDYDALMDTVRRLGIHLRSALPAKYVGVKVLGSDVPHTHVHLIPFNQGNEFHRQPDESHEPDHEALAAIAVKLAF